MQAARRIGVIVGSSRKGGNGAGIAAWVANNLKKQLTASRVAADIVTVDPRVSPHPFGPVVEGHRIPAQITSSEDYGTLVLQEWSKFVSSCAAFAVVSPEYNGGYPGELKNSLDHLYHEWANKPVILLTYGSGGGLRVSDQLKTILTSLKLEVLDPVAVRVPRTFIAGPDRVSTNSTETPEFLNEFEPQVTKAVQDLAKLLTSAPETS
ncbi:flavoprotein-like protein [Irpex rosettiformis]|uniref:Flavoprotein-like protein n=1 Tax=Irpex rosettiformis TaxID=378272 RepID=A0ACB8UKW0_9APHY|nr:flavoprotein-like protein [Irpex rosettiformis]